MAAVIVAQASIRRAVMATEKTSRLADFHYAY
jgi:hypothetical protein